MMPGLSRLNADVARILRLGAYVSAGIIGVGFMASVLLGPGSFSPKTSIAPSLPLLFKQPWPLILMNLGVLLLMVTPVAWVLAAAISFARRKEVKLALVSATVLGILLFAIVFGLK